MAFWQKRNPEPEEPDFSGTICTLYGNLHRSATELAVFADEMTEEEATALCSIRDWAGRKYREMVQELIDELE